MKKSIRVVSEPRKGALVIELNGLARAAVVPERNLRCYVVMVEIGAFGSRRDAIARARRFAAEMEASDGGGKSKGGDMAGRFARARVSGMSERPILFSAPMVRALREGRKIQTRRTRGLEKINAEPDVWRYLTVDSERSAESGHHEHIWQHVQDIKRVMVIPCPYGVAGDRLWTRESFVFVNCERERNTVCVAYPADGETLPNRPDCQLTTKQYAAFMGDSGNKKNPFDKRRYPSIHMPRWASRDTLEVVSARPERLQAITEADAIAEGCRADEDPYWKPSYHDPDSGGNPSARNSFEYLWDLINAKKLPWSKNPWVWRVEFRREIPV